MSTRTDTPREASGGGSRWAILLLVGVAQLMVVLDATIVNIALPSAQDDLGFSTENRQWVVTAYALAFGSLLLLGGRIGDLFGRQRMFVIGLFGFAIASALGGLASGFGVLVAARALQGVFAALLAPAALAILSTTFAQSDDRDKAFGIYGALAGIGAGVGLLLGGLLTDVLSWRWCLYVNLAFAVPTAIAALKVIPSDSAQTQGQSRSIDLPGALTASIGLFALVFAVSNAETNGWSSTLTIVGLALAPILLIAFVLIERRVAAPLLPLRVVVDPTRGGSFFATAVLGVVIFGVFLFLTFYLQQNLGYSPLKAGLAFMPLNLTIIFVSGLTAGVLLPKFGPRPLVGGGLLLGAIGSMLFAQITSDSGYAVGVLPGLIVTGIGAGFLFTTTFATATLGVDPHDTGVASAMLNTAQQVGGSIGIAVLSTLFASSVKNYAEENPGPSIQVESVIHGYTTVFWLAAAITLVGAVIATLLIRTSRKDLQDAGPTQGVGAH